MNRGINYWVSLPFTRPSSLHTKVKFMKKNRLSMIASTRRKQMLIMYVSSGLLQRNKDSPTPLEQANKMISRFLLLVPSFTKKEGLKKFTEFFNNMQVFHPMYSMLYTVNVGLCDYVPFSQIRSHIMIILHCRP